ncbi:MAG: hypothetical protein IJR28_05850 [Ottowia sp.]|nr:hypothetical protein [Ottowia sp.]
MSSSKNGKATGKPMAASLAHIAAKNSANTNASRRRVNTPPSAARHVPSTKLHISASKRPETHATASTASGCSAKTSAADAAASIPVLLAAASHGISARAQQNTSTVFSACSRTLMACCTAGSCDTVNVSITMGR